MLVDALNAEYLGMLWVTISAKLITQKKLETVNDVSEKSPNEAAIDISIGYSPPLSIEGLLQ
jgi:hypothetical protein